MPSRSLHRSVEPPLDYPSETWQVPMAAEVFGGDNPDAGPKQVWELR